MSIIKNTPNILKHSGLPFTTVINKTIDLIKDPATLGIYVYLAGKPQDWRISETNLQNRFDKCRDFVRSRLSELKKLGLIKSVSIRDNKNQIIRWETTLFNEPYTSQELESKEVLTPKPTLLEIQAPGKARILVKPPTTNKRLLEIKEETNIIPDFKKSGIKKSGVSKIKDYKKDDRFMRFYEAYPRKVDPQDAWKAFKSIIGDDDALLETILSDIALRISKHSLWQDKQYIKYPAVYLRKGEYLGEIFNTQEQNQEKEKTRKEENDKRIQEQDRVSKLRAEELRKNEINKQQDARAYRNIIGSVKLTESGRPEGLKNLRKEVGLG